MKRISSVLWGVVLIAVGVVLALNAFEITRINLFFDGWWTLIIIVPSVIGLFTDYDKSGSIIGICIGVFLLLCCQGVLNFGMFWKLLIPMIVVVIGVKMILGNLSGDKGEQVFKRLKAENGEIRNGAAVFSGATMDYTGEVFEGAELEAVFGGMKCDLRNAVIQSNCVIHASAVFGGIDIYVPENVNVKVNSHSIFGGVSGKEHRNHPENSYTLYLNATCMFGGVEVK